MSKISKITAVLILGLMFVLLFFSAWNDSATMDELAHIPSGYSYLTQNDYRLNPEHPPLIKDLSALPLVFLNLNFPTNVPEWTKHINGQWDMGRIFIYESGNNADRIIRFSRFPIMLLAILFGWMLFKWTSKLYGDKVGLLTLFFFAFSPTMIAHSRYVTTDLGAAFGFFIGLASFINFLKTPTRKNIVIAGIAFGIAQLLKFSLVILAPIYLLLAAIWIFVDEAEPGLKYRLKRFGKIVWKIILIGIIGLLVIWPVYQFHVWDYPPERQMADTEFTLSSFGIRPLADSVIWLADKPVLRAWGQYFFGVLMVMQRAAGGNTGYFLGSVSSSGTPLYFPLLYLLKESLAFHILTLIALIFGIRNIINAKEKSLRAASEWARDNFVLVSAMIFIAVYFLQTITSNLNIGIRHVMPTLPFIYLLVARQTARWVKSYEIIINGSENIFDIIKNLLKNFYRAYIKPLKKCCLVAILLAWMFLSAVLSAPHYVSYFNALGGGTMDGYKIAVDSNYDWGQDLKRLKDFVEDNDIEKIKIDYFGGGNPAYYFGEKYESWWSSKGAPEPGNWFAISATFLQSSKGKPAKGFVIKPEDSYPWLNNKQPVARAGTSIFIYKF
ncbi:glycosyltransferase family 39 protein [Patescibacteria group bacterium]|nr:glycosyltransferase family 39 protein [Patescibacteria group bacterium]MBU4353154.1 glycosyltransferase family 39 protein [Patescibacteria group bacterium]MBU4477308.1 glycosyltransferase family 39 protein [Patescibacteria group bacterium]MCG2698842.1 glycosyltransferase family 39 protein [Candidatus Parcubacteria bacterium]